MAASLFVPRVIIGFLIGLHCLMLITDFALAGQPLSRKSISAGSRLTPGHFTPRIPAGRPLSIAARQMLTVFSPRFRSPAAITMLFLYCGRSSFAWARARRLHRRRCRKSCWPMPHDRRVIEQRVLIGLAIGCISFGALGHEHRRARRP